MGIKNLTEAEEKEFYRLVGKMNGEEPDKKQDAKVKKPQINECYYIVDNDGASKLFLHIRANQTTCSISSTACCPRYDHLYRFSSIEAICIRCSVSCCCIIRCLGGLLCCRLSCGCVCCRILGSTSNCAEYSDCSHQ